MKPLYTLIVAILAFVAGSALTAAYFLPALAREKENAIRTPEEVTLLVAKKKIDRWEIVHNPRELFEPAAIHRMDVKGDPIPADQLDQLEGRRVRLKMARGDWLTQEHLLRRRLAP